jgi:hypothetical protein
MDGDRYIVVKLVSGEEVIAHLIGEDDYEIRVLFPMIVRHTPRMTPHGPGESISMSPYTYFSAEDEYTFHKNQIIFLKDLDAKYEDEYNRAIDDFVGSHSPAPYNPEEMKELAEKLQTMFKDRIQTEEEIDDLPLIHIDISKTIH